jgi:mannitol/fructose-specific phosphotransferase system IIA component (Ntr-type)
MRLAHALREECIVPGAQFHNRAVALWEIASLAKKCPVLKDVDQGEILSKFQEHHIPDSVNLPTGVTILHCHLESVDDFLVGLVTVPSAVEFEVAGARESGLIIFIIAPEARTREYNELLWSISQALHIPGVVEEILAETTSEGLHYSFLFNVEDTSSAKFWLVTCLGAAALICILYRTGLLRLFRSLTDAWFSK